MNWKRFFTILAILTLIIFGVYFIFQYNNIEQSITITDLFKLVDEYKIKYIQISGNKVKAIGVNNFQYITGIPNDYSGILLYFIKHNIPVYIVQELANWTMIINQIINGLFYLALLFFFSPSSKRSNYIIERPKIKFKDVIGLKEAKAELREVMLMRKSPEKFERFKCRPPKGALLYGPPGNGKTFLVKALAGEEGLNFLYASASEFINMYVGTGPASVRRLFNEARKNSPCLLFIDEADSIGSRENNFGSASTEYKSTINQLLEALDGIRTTSNIFVVFATNYPDALDAALIRSGRIDKKIAVLPPMANERYELLEHYVQDIPRNTGLDLYRIARGTMGMSRADMETLVNEAKLIAVFKEDRFLNTRHLEIAKENMTFGRPNQYTQSKKELMKTSYHEAGHTFVSIFYGKPVYKVTIVSVGGALGYMMPDMSEEDLYSQSRRQIRETVHILFGGRIAEEIFLGLENVTTGCSSDIAKARNLVEKYVTYALDVEHFGFGYIATRNEMRSEEEKSAINMRVNILMNQWAEETKKIMYKHKDNIEKLAEKLYEKETLWGTEAELILKQKYLLPELYKTIKTISI